MNAQLSQRQLPTTAVNKQKNLLIPLYSPALCPQHQTALEITYCDLVSIQTLVSAAAKLYFPQPESAQWLVCE